MAQALSTNQRFKATLEVNFRTQTLFDILSTQIFAESAILSFSLYDKIFHIPP